MSERPIEKPIVGCGISLGVDKGWYQGKPDGAWKQRGHGGHGFPDAKCGATKSSAGTFYARWLCEVCSRKNGISW